MAAVLALPLLMLLIPGRSREAAPAEGAAARLERAGSQRQARARVLGATLGVVILAALGLGFVYSQPPAALSAATAVSRGRTARCASRSRPSTAPRSSASR